MKSDTSPYVSPGMPPLESKQNTVSAFEFWPMWLMYFPVVCQWLWLSLRHRSLTLPLLANPNLPLSGMVGVPKSALFRQASGRCNDVILDWFVFDVTAESVAEQVQRVEQTMDERRLVYPLVCKPDIGCRGSGVKLVRSGEQLANIIARYPADAPLMMQRLSSYEPEAGVFFVRQPDSERGEIVSLALKYTPYVVGDGVSTLRELIEADERAGDLMRLYEERHEAALGTVIGKDEPYKLVFSASHCRGAIFRDGRQYVSEKLTDAINEVMSGLPDFYYGRLDVKFKDIESLMNGDNIEVVEINGASAESLHIWDSDATIKDAFTALLFQYRTLFHLGAAHRKGGAKTPGLMALLKGVATEKSLQKYYPTTD